MESRERTIALSEKLDDLHKEQRGGGLKELLELYKTDRRQSLINDSLESKGRIELAGASGSSLAFIVASQYLNFKNNQLVVFPDREKAAYFLNDLENLLGDECVFFFPDTGLPAYGETATNNANILLRAEVLSALSKRKSGVLVVSYPEALRDKVISQKQIEKVSLDIKVGELVDSESLLEILIDYGFERVPFVIEPGQFSIRGGIIDVFSFANDDPFRIELFGDEVESIRSFDIEGQLSIKAYNNFSIVPNINTQFSGEEKKSFLTFFKTGGTCWIEDPEFISASLSTAFEEALTVWDQIKKEGNTLKDDPASVYYSPEGLLKDLSECRTVLLTKNARSAELNLNTLPQVAIRKKFDFLIEQMRENERKGFRNILFADTKKQIQRLQAIFEDLNAGVDFYPYFCSIHEGFIDQDLKLSIFTDHQVFERYHQYKLKSQKLKSKSLTLKQLGALQKGDYVVHIDHGIGKYDGLEILEVNGKKQESVRLSYKDNDMLYVGVNSLHKISRYSSSEGKVPGIAKLGSEAWKRLKSKTKKKVKTLAIDLVKLYAKRKAKKGFEFTPDTYLQHELEASFIYEDTPDQEKATAAVKADMEKKIPMDRLICGDVGFGKTEIAIRAAFKAVADNKQVAIMVPTTILALQHFRTFSERLEDLPCRVDYVNRFRSSAQIKQIVQELAEGKIDILIGTHQLAGKRFVFKDLGLLIIDEEQKFGVGIKEKLKSIRVNVDTLTLTATPIPRTLQFSLMGARDLSVINTPPPNRQPVQTELITLNEDRIRDAITFEIERGGQVFFVHNRVRNIMEVAQMIHKLCPEVSIGVAHGQMPGHELEEELLTFIAGDYDVLISTNIIESGLDIPNANTILINQAQHFGLSDLHQMRGRVGRSNKKAFCYLVVPPLSTLSSDARKRLRAIEEYSELGSGFSIAMRDLDIRGAGNLLGAEQSGFISEIGLETYQKILDEAMMELRDSEYSELFAEAPEQALVSDCQVETDIEALIPNQYVRSTSERLQLYMELDNAESEEQYEKFRAEVLDRFGPVPTEVERLIDLVKLRVLAKKLAIEKLVLKKNRLTMFFVDSKHERFYNSELFGQVLNYVQSHPNSTKLEEKNNKAMVKIHGVKSIATAMSILDSMLH